ncbi:MAG: metallophosphoesterase [Treponema sp.]|nr:metallophosphoesterase [Treponema sp.]
MIKKTLAFLIFCLSFTSCKYGLTQAFYRKHGVNERAAVIKTISNPVTDVQADSVYSVVLVSDIHFGSSRKRADEKFLEAFTAICESGDEQLHPLFAINVGDMTETASKKEYDDFLALCNSMKQIAKDKNNNETFEVYSILGNHDVFNNGWNVYKEKVFPYTSYYRFYTGSDDKKIGWYFLDSASGSLGTKQIKNLEQEMKNDSSVKIVINHYPLFENNAFYFAIQNTDEADRLLSLFAKNNVKHIFAGHFHTGWEYDHGCFKETGVKGYLGKRKFALLTIDQRNGVFNVKHFEF